MNAIADKSYLTIDSEPAREASSASSMRHTRRLSDKVRIAFHNACDVNDLDVAEHLLRVLEMMTMRRPRPGDGNRRRNMESLVAAHERLWHLRHPER
jgi:hypothetical protein